MSVTPETSHFEMSPLNNLASRNIRAIALTLDTSHFEMSPSNHAAPWNMAPMPVTLDTSHAPIGPCELSEHSPFADDFRQIVTAVLSSALDFGENKNRPVHKFGERQITRAKKMT